MDRNEHENENENENDIDIDIDIPQVAQIICTDSQHLLCPGGWKMGDESGTVCGIHTIVGTLNGVVALALAFRTSPEILASDQRERRP